MSLYDDLKASLDEDWSAFEQSVAKQAERLAYPALQPPAERRRAPRRNPNLRDTDLPEPEVRAPSHTAALFESPQSFERIVRWVSRHVRAGKFDAIAGSGHSGLLVIGAVAVRTGVRMLAVRKDDDSPKGDSRRVNGALPNTPCRYAFIDDLVSSGETLRRVHGSIGYAFPQAELAGLIMYRSHYPADLRCDLARVIGPERAERALVKVFDDWSNDDSTD